MAMNGMEVLTTDLTTGKVDEAKVKLEGLGMVLGHKFDTFSRARTVKEEVWLESWANYLGSPESVHYLRSRVARIVGNVNSDWRHHVSTAKGYEIIETVNAYLMGAFFPNRDWFEIIPTLPGMAPVAGDVKKLIMQKMHDAKFKSKWEMYTRQALITGFSAIALPWRRKTKDVTKRVRNETKDAAGATVVSYDPMTVEELIYNSVDIEVLDCFDVYLDPIADANQNDADLFRVLRKSKGEVMRCIDSGVYPHLDKAIVAAHGQDLSVGSRNKKKAVAQFAGIDYDPKDMVELHEFWGTVVCSDLEYNDVVITILGNNVARAEKNPYWRGRPIIVGTPVPLPNQVYGLGLLEPVLGMLQQLTILTNQRLDNQELTIDSTWMMVNDGVTDPDEVYMAPGHVITVGDMSSIQPVPKPHDFQVTYNESTLLEQTIDQAVGTGAYIGTQQGRSGERVTATEIQAVRDAGGNRLSSLHAHMEDTQLLPLVERVVFFMQQFVSQEEILRVQGADSQSFDYVMVGPEEINQPWKVSVIGADYIVNKQESLQKVVDFVNLTAQFEQWSSLVNWESLLRLTVKKFGFDNDVERLIISQLPPEQDDSYDENEPPLAENNPVSEAAALRQQSGGQAGAANFAAMAAMQGPGAAAGAQAAGLTGADAAMGAQLGEAMSGEPPLE